MTPADDEHALNSTLPQHDDVLILPVLVPAGADVPPVSPLAVLLLVLLRQRTAERDAFRDWITQDPTSPSDSQLCARAAEAASNLARRDSP
ncbi:hypothetical protein ACFXKW_09605 [Streptomyces sp. NPDC059193]|uniref:hypothetical protein n=1 Tax=Streptomyces sp. NPDC059193 TaxID=3346763 RepID=UPI00369F19D2